MVTASELVVAMRGEGIDETTGQIEGMEDQFEETADSVGESADEMDGFADKWKGAMGAVVAGLAVGAAGLLSQIPVIGELFGGLISVIDAVVYQIDKVLRPALTPLTNLFYDISSAIFDLDGALGNVFGAAIIAGIVAVGAAIAGLSAPIIAIASVVTGTLLLAWSLFHDEIMAVVGFIVDGVTGAFDWLVTAITDPEEAIKELVGFLSDITDWVTTAAEGAFDWLVSAIDPVMNILVGEEGNGGVLGALGDISDWATSAVEGAFDWISNALSGPADVVSDILDDLQTIAEKTWDTIIDIVMQLTDPITGPPGGVESAAGDFFTGAADFLNPTTSVGSGDTTSGFLNSGGGETQFGNQTINLDGRRMSEDTGRYRYDETASRSRFG